MAETPSNISEDNKNQESKVGSWDRRLRSEKGFQETWATEFSRLSRRFHNGEAPPAPVTHSGMPIKPCYFLTDIDDISPDDINAPGSVPFTRGLYASQYQLFPWANQPVIGYGLPEHTRERMDSLRAQGMTGYMGRTFYNLVYDLVSHQGIDPDHPAAAGRVGKDGMAVYCRQDMEILFRGLDLTAINVVHITDYEVLPVLAHYLAYAQTKGVPWDALRGNTMNWYYISAYCGMSCFPPEMGKRLAVELIRFCGRHMPQWNTLNLFGYGIEEAGGNAVHEIGLVVAAGIEYAKSCIDAGMNPNDVLGRFGFQIAQANDFFEEIAKVRALRQIWAKQCRKLGATKASAMHARIHTHTSGAVLTGQQPLVNLIRTTLHALGAALAGVQAMEVSSFDEALAIPTEMAHTLSLRVQQVIQEETNITAVTDPLGGSYYVERLTADLVQAGENLIDELEKRGGYTRNHAYVRSLIEERSARWRNDVESGRRVMVGVNKYDTPDPLTVEVFEVPPQDEAISVKRIRELRQLRDPSKWQKAMRRVEHALGEFADGRQGLDLIPAMVEASLADATTGELMEAMKKHLGWISPY